MTRYEQGFLTKCAEYGLDTDTSMMLMQKQAINLAAIGKMVGRVGSRIGNAAGRLGSRVGSTVGNFGRNIAGKANAAANGLRLQAAGMMNPRTRQEMLAQANKLRRQGQQVASRLTHAGNWIGRNNKAVGGGIMGAGGLAAAGAAGAMFGGRGESPQPQTQG